jgi:two-component system phosphate regulon sensor histidine kinase PhoR
MRRALAFMGVQAMAVGLLVAALHHMGASALAMSGAASVLSALLFLMLVRSMAPELDELKRVLRRASPAHGGNEGYRGLGAQVLERLLEQRAGQISFLMDEVRALTTVLDAMTEGVWVTDETGEIVRHNVALGDMVQPGQILVGQWPLTVIRSHGINDAVRRACKGGETTTIEIPVEGNRPRLLLARVGPLGAGIPGSVALFRDVTELRRLENVCRDFVANVSHELRTPITAIRGYAETLRDGALEDRETAEKMVDVIHRQSERLSELVSDLLELSRLEGDGAPLSRAEVGVAEAVAQALEVIRPKVTTKKLVLESRIESGLRVVADPRALEQVLLNLVENSVKYTPDGGRIEVAGQAEGGRCTIAVHDTGVGIEAKHLPRIFERFYRVDKGRGRELGGTGLGLAIVKHLVHAMGGEVRVSSAPGDGSTFFVVLPTP